MQILGPLDHALPPRKGPVHVFHTFIRILISALCYPNGTMRCNRRKQKTHGSAQLRTSCQKSQNYGL